VPGIVGFGAAAAALASGTLEAEREQARAWTSAIVAAAGAGRLGTGVDVLGDPDPDGRLPSLVCLAVAGVEAEPVLLGLDAAGVAVHSGSACSSEALVPSPVLEAMGADAERSLRISVGWSTTEADVAAVGEALPDVVARLRALATAGGR
jgi:cysteine desulfurase